MILAVLVVLGALCVCIFLPLLRDGRDELPRDDASEDRVAGLVKEKESSYTAIHELEFDYRMGKLSEDDYRDLYGVYKSEAVRAIEGLDLGEGFDRREDRERSEASGTPTLDAQIEEEIRRKRRELVGPGATPRCPRCGISPAADARFCPRCGSTLVAFCPRCKGFSEAGASYCSRCGNLLATATSTRI